eukprot:COSAG04_NODE_809_length_10142_cov_3.378174_10_plen_131_part_00
MGMPYNDETVRLVGGAHHERNAMLRLVGHQVIPQLLIVRDRQPRVTRTGLARATRRLRTKQPLRPQPNLSDDALNRTECPKSPWVNALKMPRTVKVEPNNRSQIPEIRVGNLSVTCGSTMNLYLPPFCVA